MYFSVFEENAYVHESMQLNEDDDVIGQVLTANADQLNKKILIASRHFRNDSRTIQLEQNIHRCDESIVQMNKPRKHYRSNSCDVRLIRCNSKEWNNYYNDHRLRSIMRSGAVGNNSRDFEQQLISQTPQNRQTNLSSLNSAATHLQDQQLQQQSNFKYILNQLKQQHSTTNNLDVNQILTNHRDRNNSINKNKHHIRNNSYGQEFSFLPNSAIIRLNNNCANKFLLNSTSNLCNRNSSRKNSKDINNDVHVILLKNAIINPSTPATALDEIEYTTKSSNIPETITKNLDVPNRDFVPTNSTTLNVKNSNDVNSVL